MLMQLKVCRNCFTIYDNDRKTVGNACSLCGGEFVFTDTLMLFPTLLLNDHGYLAEDCSAIGSPFGCPATIIIFGAYYVFPSLPAGFIDAPYETTNGDGMRSVLIKKYSDNLSNAELGKALLQTALDLKVWAKQLPPCVQYVNPPWDN